ncbi:MAG: hypothetical protein SNJ58_14810 [Aggregatilineales bacterium]
MQHVICAGLHRHSHLAELPPEALESGADQVFQPAQRALARDPLFGSRLT